MIDNIWVNEQNSVQIKTGSGMVYIDPFRIKGTRKGGI